MRDDGVVSPEMSGIDQTSGSPTGELSREPQGETPAPPGDRRTAAPGGSPRHSPRRLLALAGVIAAAAGLALSQAAAQALRASTSPVEAVAAAVRDLTPGPLAVFLIHLVGRLDKPLLLGGTALVVLGICAYAASWVRRFPLVPDLVFFALAALGLAAVLSQPRPGLGSSLALMVGLVTWIVVLRLLTKPFVEGGTDSSEERRSFLKRSAWVVGVVALLSVAGRAAGGGRRNVEQARRLLRLPVRRGSVPAGVSLGVAGIESWRTSNENFYIIHTALAPPSISPSDWQLRIHGMVDREITLTYQDLIDRQLTEAWVTLCCVSNEVGGDLIGNAYWSGVLVRDLLLEAGVQDGADAVRQTSRDGWDCGTPLRALTDDRNAMLAVAMNGKPLPVEHGFPVRMVVPGLYGYVSATKWLVDLEVTSFDKFSAFWTERGWSERGPVKTQSRIDVPADGASVPAGSVRVGGSAWAQHTGIEKVEYQLDGGAWEQAEIGGAAPDDDTWVQWAATVDVAEGGHQLVVRATDKSGYTQTSVKTDVIPNGASGWDSRSFNAG